MSKHQTLTRSLLLVFFGAVLPVVQPKVSFNSANTSPSFMDASDVKWAHAVNSRKELEKQLAGSDDFLEADISMGHVVGNAIGPPFPIMAHPPDIVSDISLESWLDTVIARSTEKGVKLDFKTIETVEPSLRILQKHGRKVNFPLWLNADILPGPVEARTVPVEAAKFIALCDEYFPNATLSVGWTTLWFLTIPEDSWFYDWRHIRAMVDTLRCAGVKTSGETKLTFPVRAIFANKSIPQLQWLLRTFPQSTLTVWSSRFDSIKLEDLLKIRRSFHISRVFYDIPDPMGTEFQKSKTNVSTVTDENVEIESGWRIVEYGKSNISCSSASYVDKSTVVFGRETDVAILLKDSYIVAESKSFKVKGFVKFFSSTADGTSFIPSEGRDLVFSLADISAFKKPSISQQKEEDDADVIWNALNSSRLYTLHHEFSDSSSCYFFKLDTSNAEAFQVWKLPYYVILDDISEENMLKQGKQQIDSNARLVLPSGSVLLGFVSSGGGQAVLYGLEIGGEMSVLPSTSISAGTSLHIFPVVFWLAISFLI